MVLLLHLRLIVSREDTTDIATTRSLKLNLIGDGETFAPFNVT